MHEIGHALGYWHEQSRPDCDTFVRIVRENIKPKYLWQFAKRTALTSRDALEYDYDTIMQYSRKAFNKNGNDTIIVSNMTHYLKQGSPKLGQRYHLSKLDIFGMKVLYQIEAGTNLDRHFLM